MAKLFSSRWTKYSWIKYICLLVVSYGAYKGFSFWKKHNDGFVIDRVYTKLPNSPEWEIPLSNEKRQEVNEILAQPYTYLDHGFQVYAFESRDDKYVLKFLRHQRLHPPVLYDWLPDCSFVRDLKAKKCQKRSDRVKLLFESLQLAYTHIPEETGLIYVHLNKTKNQFKEAFVVDRAQNEYSVPLDDTEFVLQHKAMRVKPTIKGLMKSGRVAEAKVRINQLFDLLKTTAQKGILDTDGALINKNNIGFIHDRAIYIDVGRFVFKESIKDKERFAYDLRRLKPFYKWLVSNYPPLAAHFDRQQKKVLESF